MAFQVKNLLDRVKSVMGGAPQSLSGIGRSLNDDEGYLRKNQQTGRRTLTFGKRGNQALRTAGSSFLDATSFLPTREVAQITMGKSPLLRSDKFALSQEYVKPLAKAAGKTAALATVQGLAPALSPFLSKVPLAGRGLAAAAQNPIGLGLRGMANPKLIATSGALGAGISAITGQDPLQGAAQAAGRAPGLGFGLGMTSPVLQGMGTTLNAIRNPVARQAIGRTVSGGANIAEGLVLDQLTGLPTTKGSIAIDFLAGAAMPGQVGLKRNSQIPVRVKPKDVVPLEELQRILKQGKIEAPVLPPKNYTPLTSKDIPEDLNYKMQMEVAQKINIEAQRAEESALSQKVLEMFAPQGKPTQAAGMLFGFEFEQDENGKMRVGYDPVKGMVGLGITLGIQNVRNKGAFDDFDTSVTIVKNPGKHSLEDVQAATETLTREFRRQMTDQEFTTFMKGKQPFEKALEMVQPRIRDEEISLGLSAKSKGNVMDAQASKSDPLTQEARGKSLEEFVESQSKLLHGTENKFDEFDITKRGTNEKDFPSKNAFFFTDSLDTAKSYGKNIQERYGKFDKPLVIDAKGEMYSGGASSTDMKQVLREAVEKAQKDGNDVVIVKNLSDRKDWGNYEPATHYAVLDINKLKTKSQLTDIWNKANKSDDLVSQARKYKSAELRYVRNPEKSMNMGSRFGQDIEPAGKYMSLMDEGQSYVPPGWETGKVSFKNPLVLDWGEGYTSGKNWKNILSEKYGGKKGKELSSAIAKDGYDGIITLDKGKPSEVVSLTDIWNKANGQKGEISNNLMQDVGGGAVGSLAGFEKDENGKWRYNPTKGAFGAAVGVGASRQLSGRGVKLGLGTEDVSKRRQPTMKVKDRGFVESVQEAPKVSKQTKLEVTGEYTPKQNKELMGEARALLEDGATIKFKNVKGIDQKIAATIQEAVNLDKAGDHQAAANLYNNLAEQGTELGRGVQAFSLLQKMSPEAVALSAAGKINRYNEGLKLGAKKIPTLTGEQQKLISDQVQKIDGLTGREKNMAINELQETLNSFIPSTLADKAITVWKAGLLTSLRTHERNLLGNSIMSGSELIKDAPADFYDQLMSFKTGRRTLKLTGRGTIQGAVRGGQAAKDIITKGYDPEDAIAKYDVKRVNWGTSKVGKFLKVYTDTVFRTLAAGDKPFWHSMYARSLYDQAAAEAMNAGKQGDTAFIKQLVEKPTEDMLLTATRDANYATFHDKNQLSEIASALKRVAGKNEYSKILSEVFMPFTGVPSSIVGKTLAYSPLGLIKGIDTARKVVINNIPELQREAAQQLGRGTMGSAIFALGAYLMQQGLMTGQAKDQKERDLWQAQGKMENSILVDGKWRNIGSIGPQNLILLAGAKYSENASDPEGSISKYGAAMGKDQLSQTFMQGVQGPLQAVNDPDRYAKSYIGRTAASVIPNIVKDAAKSGDKSVRETNTLSDYMISGLPGGRQQLISKRDVLGNEIKQEPTGAAAFIDLFNSRTPIDNKTLQELERLNEAGLAATPSKIDRTQRINKKDVELTYEQLNYYEKETGKILKPRLQALIESPQYQSLEDEKKKDAIGNLVTDVRTEWKKQNAGYLTGQTKFETEKDSPKGVGKVGINAVSLAANPVETMLLWQRGEPVRKMRLSGDNTFEQAFNFFDSVSVSERAKNVGGLDKGDKSTQVDHIVPKWLGGRETPDNYQILTVEEHSQKTDLDEKLLKEYEAGDIKKKEAIAQIMAFNSKLNPKSIDIPQKEDLAIEMMLGNRSTGKTYEYTDAKGNVKALSIEPPTKPNYTGNAALDKKLKSKYSGKITTAGNNIIKLYEAGTLSAEEAGKAMDKLASTKAKSGGKGKKKKGPKVTFSKIKSPKVSKASIKFGKLSAPKKAKKSKLTLKSLQSRWQDRRIKA